MKIAALSSRVDRLLAEAKARNRLPLWKLTAAQREAHSNWRAHSDAIINDHEAAHGSGSFYAAFREGTSDLLDMPHGVRKVLHPEPTPQIVVGTSPGEAARIYQNYARSDG